MALPKKDFRLLERVFAAEISSSLPFQSNSKEYKRLEQDGFVEQVEITLPGRFRVTVRGWFLTHAGRFAYCNDCKEIDENGEAK